MSTAQTTGEMKATREVKTVSTPDQRLGTLIVLVFLILVGVGGIAVLCYKLQNPTTTLVIEGR